MTVVTVHQAKTHLSSLLKRAEAGEEIVVARGKVPVATLVPYRAAAERRRPGALRGQLVVGPAFFDPLPEDELNLWER